MIKSESHPNEDPSAEAKRVYDEGMNRWSSQKPQSAIELVPSPSEINSNTVAGAAITNTSFSFSENSIPLSEGISFTSHEDNNQSYNSEMTNPSREEMKHALQATQSDVSAITEKLRADFAEHRGDMKSAVEMLRGDMLKASSESLRWTVGVAITLVGLAVTILTFVINNAAKVPQIQQPQQQQPVIVNVMPSAQPTAVPPAK